MTTITNIQDAQVRSNRPAQNFNRAGRMYLGSGAHAFIYFGLPFPRGAQVVSATVKMYSGTAVTDTNLRIACRRALAKWRVGQINWNNQPSVSGLEATSPTITNPPAGHEWSVDITDILQGVSNGDAWFGIRLDLNTSQPAWVHSEQSPYVARRPVIEIEWLDDPEAPTELNPEDGQIISVSHPITSFDFTDPDGGTMQAYRVQTAASEAGWDPTTGLASPAFDHTELTSIPQVRFGDIGYAGLAVDASVYWAVATQDTAGRWSDFSNPSLMTRKSKFTVTLDNPAAGASPEVNEPTPPFAWTVTGGTQTAYRLRLVDLTTNATVYDTGRVTSTATSHTPPSGKITVPGRTYRVDLFVWDNLNRAATPGDPPYVLVQRDFTFNRSNTVTTVTSVTASKGAVDAPWWQLEWVDPTMPDSYAIARDGVIIADDIDPQEVFVSGTTYRFNDMLVSGRQSHTWEILRNVNGKVSDANPVDTKSVYNTAPWLMEADGSNAIMLLNPVVEANLSEDSSVIVSQSGRMSLVTSHLGGYTGSASGLLTDENIPGLTAQQLKDRFFAIRQKRGPQEMIFLWQDEAVRCYVHSFEFEQQGNADGSTDYFVKFSFLQSDWAA